MRSTEWQYLAALTPEGIETALQSFQDRLSQDEVGIFALICEQERDAVVWLQAAANAAMMPLIGAIVPGLVIEAKFLRQGALLVAFPALIPWRLFHMPYYHQERATDLAIEALADFVTEHADQNRADTLLLLVDAKIPNVTSILDRLYLEIGDQVNYVGTCVGSETFQPMPCLFDSQHLIQEALCALVLRQHPGAVLAHHYRGNESLWVATATTGSYVKAIDGEPAFKVYQRLMASEYGITLDRENFYRYAVHFPFALNRAHGESIVRIPVLVEEDGSVYCSGEVPENALLSVVRAVPPGSLETVREIGAWMRPRTAVGSALTFYCAGRLMHLGMETGTAELAALVEELAPIPLFGALSLGEIGAGQRHYPAFHNATIVALPWI